MSEERVGPQPLRVSVNLPALEETLEMLANAQARVLELEAEVERLREYWGDTLGVVIEVRRLREALERIAGPADEHDPRMAVYVAAGGGYEGLQALAREALARFREGGG